MTEFYTVKKIDNSRLLRPASAHGMHHVARSVGLGALVVLGTLLYAWQHFACIQLSYQLESLKAEMAQAAEKNEELKLEAAGLRAPSRIDDIARNQLGLTAPAAGQVAPFDTPAEPVFAELKGAATASSR
jgi:cell division protein FtsL